jgi:L-alanine-DL-glutamate epimerase-like enolase superfamily enzyme
MYRASLFYGRKGQSKLHIFKYYKLTFQVGLALLVISAVDLALWDLLGKVRIWLTVC